MLDEIHAVHNYLISSHKLNVPIDWLEACISWVKSEYQNETLTLKTICGYVFDQWLSSDLREIGFSSLPTDVLTAQKIILNETYCLQINSIYDISKSLFSQIQKLTGKSNENVDISAATQNWKKEIKSSRMLMLKLTDGNVEISGMEFKFIPSLNLNINPGTKIIVKNGVICRNGTLMLTPDNICVLGGMVETLVEGNNHHVALQSLLQNNIENGNRGAKYLPIKTFDSIIKSKLKSELKTKIDFDDDDDEMLINSDGQAIQNDACKSYKKEISSNQFSSLKRPRLDSYNDNNEIKNLSNNINFKSPNDINFFENGYINNQDIKQEIIKDNLSTNDNLISPECLDAYKLIKPNNNYIYNEASNDYNILEDIADNDFNSISASTPTNKLDQNITKVTNLNNFQSIDDQFYIDTDQEEEFIRQPNISVTKNNPTNSTFNSMYALPEDFLNDFEDSESNSRNMSKVESTKIPSNTDTSAFQADNIVNDIVNIIGTQSNCFNLINKTNTHSKENIFNSQEGREFYDKCVDLFRDDDVEEISNFKNINKDDKCIIGNKYTDNILNNEQFDIDYMCGDSVLEANNLIADQVSKNNKINLYDPFTYISVIKKNNLTGIYSIKAYVVTILGTLGHNFGNFWDLTVKINDGSAALDIQLSDDVITNIFGMSAMECHRIKLLAAKDLDARSRLMESLNQFKECLINLSAILDVKFEVGSVPLVTNIRPITNHDIELLQDRIIAYKFT